MPSTFIRSVRAAVLTLAMVAVSASGTVAQEVIEGDWEGTIAAGAQGDIAMALQLTAGADGIVAGTIDVPSQGGFDVPLEDVTFQDGVFSFGLSVAGPGSGYEGTLSEDGTAINGMWTQAGAAIELIFTRPEEG